MTEDSPNDRDLIDERVSDETRELITFLSEFRTADLPDDVRHESTRCLLDFVGVAVGAAHEEAP